MPDIVTEIERFEDQVRASFPVEEFSLYLSHGATIELSSLIILKEHRNRGWGSLVMKALCDFADRHGMIVWLSAAERDPRSGTTSRTRLVRFYKGFGFVLNKGRNKRYDLSLYGNMYRLPE